MFDIDNFIGACESMKIFEWDYSIGTESIGDRLHAILEAIIRAFRKFGIWVKGIFGKYKYEYFYASGIELLQDRYARLTQPINDALDELDNMTDLLRTRNVTPQALANLQQKDFGIDGLAADLDKFNSEIFIAVNKDRKEGVEPIQLASVKKFADSVMAWSNECQNGLNVTYDAINKLVDPSGDIPELASDGLIGKYVARLKVIYGQIFQGINTYQKSFQIALAKCQYSGRKTKQKAFAKVEFD